MSSRRKLRNNQVCERQRDRVKRARESCSLESAYKYASSFVWSECVRERERAIESKKITRLQ